MLGYADTAPPKAFVWFTACAGPPAPPRCDSLSPRRGPICETPARDRRRHRRLLRGSVQTHLRVCAQMMDGQIGGSGCERRRDGPVMITSQLCSVSLPSSTRSRYSLIHAKVKKQIKGLLTPEPPPDILCCLFLWIVLV